MFQQNAIDQYIDKKTSQKSFMKIALPGSLFRQSRSTVPAGHDDRSERMAGRIFPARKADRLYGQIVNLFLKTNEEQVNIRYL
jgi:hypothetical protein